MENTSDLGFPRLFINRDARTRSAALWFNHSGCPVSASFAAIGASKRLPDFACTASSSRATLVLKGIVAAVPAGFAAQFPCFESLFDQAWAVLEKEEWTCHRARGTTSGPGVSSWQAASFPPKPSPSRDYCLRSRFKCDCRKWLLDQNALKARG
jgi:hypothetical protein